MIADSDRSSGLGWPERSLEEGGAGSMEVYALCTCCKPLVIRAVMGVDWNVENRKLKLHTESVLTNLLTQDAGVPLQNCPIQF